MEKNYQVVPDIISSKDLDYLSDMFNWSYGALKSVNSAITSVKEPKLKEFLNEVFEFYKSNLNEILSIIQGGINEQSNM